MNGRVVIKQRILTALIALPLLVLGIAYASHGLFAGLVFVVCALALHEFYHMAQPDGGRLESSLAVVAGVCCCAGLVYAKTGPAVLISIVAPLMFLALVSLFRFRTIQSASTELAFGMLGILYVPVLLSHAIFLRELPAGRAWIFLVLLVVMASDTMAYFVGMKLGKHRLYEAVSPNKTIEGALGGLAGAVLGAALSKLWFFQTLQLVDVVVLGVLVGVFSQLGDLVESLLKRSFGVKDSGNMIPGHGGLLDRLDSLLFAFPVAFYYAIWFMA